MGQSHEVVTHTAFIMGHVVVSGLKGRNYSPEICILAKANDRVVETKAKNETSYVLLLAPGEWAVTAEVGGVVSQPINVSLHPGETAEIDFCFGRRH